MTKLKSTLKGRANCAKCGVAARLFSGDCKVNGVNLRPRGECMNCIMAVVMTSSMGLALTGRFYLVGFDIEINLREAL